MSRRTLRFPDYEDLLHEVEYLLASGYDRLGSWSLAQMCEHLAATMERSLDGFPKLYPWPMRFVARLFFFGKIMRHEPIKRRGPAPSYLLPSDSMEDQAGGSRLRAVIARLQTHTGPLSPHPVFGTITPAQWKEVHLWHSEHHLSFLIPHSS